MRELDTTPSEQAEHDPERAGRTSAEPAPSESAVFCGPADICGPGVICVPRGHMCAPSAYVCHGSCVSAKFIAEFGWTTSAFLIIQLPLQRAMTPERQPARRRPRRARINVGAAA